MARITRCYAGDVVSFIANYSKFVLLHGVPIGVYFYCHDFFFFNGEWLELLEVIFFKRRMARITRSYAGDVVSFIANYSKFVFLIANYSKLVFLIANYSMLVLFIANYPRIAQHYYIGSSICGWQVCGNSQDWLCQS